MKCSIAWILVFILVGSLLIACEPAKEKIDAERAKEIALTDMGVSANDATVHVHPENRSGQEFFTVYVTAGNTAKTYVISAEGGAIIEIKDGASHSH